MVKFHGVVVEVSHYDAEYEFVLDVDGAGEEGYGFGSFDPTEAEMIIRTNNSVLVDRMLGIDQIIEVTLKGPFDDE